MLPEDANGNSSGLCRPVSCLSNPDICPGGKTCVYREHISADNLCTYKATGATLYQLRTRYRKRLVLIGYPLFGDRLASSALGYFL